MGHAAQVMPETFKVTVLGDGQAGAINTSAARRAASKIFIFFITTPLKVEI